jgi:hypothetical protein
MRDQDCEGLDYMAISVDGKLFHQGKHVGSTSISKLLEGPGHDVVSLTTSQPEDLIGIASGENYQPVPIKKKANDTEGTEIGIVDFLKVFGFDDQLKSKLVRHQDARYDINSLIRDGWFDLYQSLQARPVFKDCEQIISFVGDGSGRARFVGVYRVLKQEASSKSKVPANCPYQEWGVTSKFHYELERRSEFANIEGRLVINWSGELAWHQHLKNRPVIEMFPKGRILDQFTDYLDFSLSYNQLTSLVANAKSHRDWVTSLSAVAGVYLILAQATGQQYVGSAYGLEGIWGRWLQYASNGHGGNKMLRELLDSDGTYPKAFLFSILQVLPKTTAPSEVIRWESLYKAKLGSRATGLNMN